MIKKMVKSMKNFYLDVDLIKRLDEEAKRTGKGKSEIAATALRKHLSSPEKVEKEEQEKEKEVEKLLESKIQEEVNDLSWTRAEVIDKIKRNSDHHIVKEVCKDLGVSRDKVLEKLGEDNGE